MLCITSETKALHCLCHQCHFHLLIIY